MKKVSHGRAPSTGLHDGLRNKAVKPPSGKMKGASIDSEATRSGVAKTMKGLGPREA